MKPFDQWSRELTDHLREKEEPKKISPEDLYTHKDVMRGEGITIATDYDPKTFKVLWNGVEFDTYAVDVKLEAGNDGNKYGRVE